MRTFVYSSRQQRIVFGSGTVDRVRAEVELLGGTRALVLAGPRGAELAGRVAGVLGPLVAARFDGAAMHTPVEVTERALAVLRESGADCLVAVGGGSTIGLAKALALRTDLPQVVLPTTYAGSEVTPVLGETADGRKVTRSSPAVLPETVVYDVELTTGLPVDISLTSAVNALAHAVEALYSPDANPVTDGLAVDAIAGIARALPRVVSDPHEPRTQGRPAPGGVAGRDLPRHRRHGPAPQARPHPRRLVRPATRRNAHRPVAAHHGLQRPGRTGGVRADRDGTGRAGRADGRVRPGRGAGRTHVAARGHGGGRPAQGRRTGRRPALPEPARTHRGRHPNPAHRCLARPPPTARATIGRRPADPGSGGQLRVHTRSADQAPAHRTWSSTCTGSWSSTT